MKIKKRRNKYNAKITIIDGIKFHSKKEARRWQQLKLLEMAGHIIDLKRQVKFPFIVNDLLICSYYADFVYVGDGMKIIEDSKGVRTAIYKIKKKLMKAIYNIDILET